MTAMRELQVLYDESGRILAVADAEAVTGPGGVVLGHRPVERAGRRSTRLALGDEHRAVGPLSLVSRLRDRRRQLAIHIVSPRQMRELRPVTRSRLEDLSLRSAQRMAVWCWSLARWLKPPFEDLT
jgi:hypothetical protein